MGEVFLTILNRSIAAGWLILAVVLLRAALKKAPKWIAVLLWGIVALRLVVPCSIESALSLVPSAETFSAHNIQYETPAISSGIPAVNHVVNPVLGETFAPNPGGSVNPLYIWMFLASAIWLIGAAAMLIYAGISYARVRQSVAESVPYEGNLFLCDHVKSPFILGLFRPKIYLPSNLEAMAMQPVIAHEKAHLARRDHWWKPLGFLILTVHWFNPLCWIAYVLLCRDIELACDEKVIRQMDLDGKKQYSTALLECSTGRRLVTFCPLAFGEVGVKERIKNVLDYKKPAFWVIAVAVVACAMVTVCFATNPARAQEICVDGALYVQSGESISKLPYGSSEIGTLNGILHQTNKHPTEHLSSANLNEKYAGCPVYRSGEQTDVIFLADFAGFYIPFVCKNGETRKLTLDDVVTLSQKGDALTWSDFERYQGRQTGSGLYIMRYEIDERFDVWVGGVPDEAPMYIRLRNQDNDASVDLREEGAERVQAFIEAYKAAPPEIEALRDQYPEYFALGTFKGLEVYVWQMAKNEYRFGLMQGTNREKTLEEKLALKGATAAEMALILSTFDIEDKDIFVIPWQNPVSSYMVTEETAKDSAYINGIRAMLGLEGVPTSDTTGANPPAANANAEAPAAETPAADVPAADASATVEATASTLSEEQAAIYQAILAHNRSSGPQEYDVDCCSFINLETLSGTPLVGSSTHKITYYGWALYEAYKVTDGGLESVSGSHVSVALSFDLDERGYTLTEYWVPREGSYYAQDIREKFPTHIVEDGIDSQKFILQQIQECYAQAAASTGLDTDEVIGTLIETICSSPALSSNPGDYINEHPIEYRELTYYGRYTLSYCFSRFEKGSETGLDGHIMMQACEDIAVGWGEEPLVFSLPDNGALTGQAWYSAFKQNALNVAERYTEIELAERYPASYLLLSMLGKV